MNEKQKRHSKIVKRFAREIYSEIIMGLAILALAIYIPFILASIFSQDIIAEEGYVMATLYWLLGLGMLAGFSMLIGGVIYAWIDSRWRKANKSVEGENGRK